ncbi:DEAD/DEAH box helicase family protein [Vibrio parahaemolyticus]|uniref:DEAD/DEAH box helicase n=1 Tax=Vibrio parahaemolyticus TaxID=670 RepID=UPI00215BFA25|nr:DEAD/DEAH box helicase family protein [Vibrio parahaemolyticus]MCR9647983.1 DEAD/DEAH box helicase family protein [Vibrio parahaemolyticus]MCR9799133.1 DEAD/DEAH box helicase family protein [Vibrio parahaemolyticus]MDF4315403.1 DEAD/DEAH box helicase family protein [Vibrio parahaemolyticus]
MTMDLSSLKPEQIRAINNVIGRLSLRQPQQDSLRALAVAISTSENKLLDPKRDVPELLETLKAQFPKLSDFERDFPSLCFALATGVGKTRLMGAFITYLYQVHGIRNYFVLAPNLTIYEKLISDFSPASPKYVFKGIMDFALDAPRVITGDNYERLNIRGGTLFGSIDINVFNIAKINTEVRGGKAPRIKRFAEVLGESYFEHLSKLPDLVLLMDESHRYRADAGMRALNELNPLFALELTATPFTESSRGPVHFKNVVIDYPLACAMDDGFVKEPAVVTQRGFEERVRTGLVDKDEIETIKLMDGVRLHQQVYVELATYAHTNSVKRVKPFMLVIARDTTHAAELLAKIESMDFFEGYYRGKVIQVDSSKKEEETIQALLNVEHVDEPTEIVIHVNMLKEGWDVTNLYTIVPLRAANARTLIEQSIGRGLRLPYGKRTGVEAVDTLSIVAHDKFQEIVDEANDPNNPLRLKTRVLDRPEDDVTKQSVQVKSNLEQQLTGSGVTATGADGNREVQEPKATYTTPNQQTVARAALDVIKQYQTRPTDAPTSKALLTTEVKAKITEQVKAQLTQEQRELFAEESVDIAAIVEQVTKLTVDNTIDIPRIIVSPSGEVRTGYHPFDLDIAAIKGLKPIDRTLIQQSLQDNHQTIRGEGDSGNYEPVKQNYILKKLFDYDDIPYDEQAELLFDLATQAVNTLSVENEEDVVENILQNQSDVIAKLIHAQLNNHFFEEATEYFVDVRSGFSTLRECAYTIAQDQPVQSYRDTVRDVSRIKQMLFGGFSRCLYPLQKFDSDTERRFAVILERDCEKWFKPAKGQFKMYYKRGSEHPEYVPDFVAETADYVLMIETKSTQHQNQDGSWNEEVTEKARSGVKWCSHASEYLAQHGGKPWKYLLIPHDAVKEANSLDFFVERYQEN